MKKIKRAVYNFLFMGVLLFATHKAESQDTTGLAERLRVTSDSIRNLTTVGTAILANDITQGNYLSPAGFDRFFDKYFTLLKYERENFTEGNSASLKVDDKSSRLDLNLSLKKNYSIFTIGTALNVSDKSGLIFSDSKPTAGTEFSFAFSQLFGRKLRYDLDDAENNWRKRQNLIDSLSDVHIIRNPAQGEIVKRKIAAINIDKSRQETSSIAIQSEIDRIRAITVSLRTYPLTLMSFRFIAFCYSNIERQREFLYLVQDSLVQTIDKKIKLVQEFETLNSKGQPSEVVAKTIQEAGIERQVQIEMETQGVTTFKMKWVSVGMKYRKDDYATYDGTVLHISQRIASQNFEKWSLNAAYNFLWQRTDKWIDVLNSKGINSFYFTGNYGLVKTNTFENLTEQSLAISQVQEQNDTTYQFSTSKKLRDITGKKFSESWQHQLGLGTTLIFGKKQFWGLNLSSTGKFQKSEIPVFDSRVGFLFRFKDSEKETSKVNFEFFFAFNDLTDTKEKDGSVWKRKQVGISANVPFNKVFFR